MVLKSGVEATGIEPLNRDDNIIVLIRATLKSHHFKV